MSIIRGPRPDSSFYTLDKTISEDDRLSWAARGLLIFLLGKPDHWRINVEHLQAQTKKARITTGRDGVYALLQELRDVGYCSMSQTRDDGGRMGGVDYVISEKAEVSTASVSAGYGPAASGQGGHIVNTDPQQGLSDNNLSPATLAAIAMKDVGVMGVNPSHPRLIDAVKAGVTAQELVDVANEFPGKSMTYIIATAQGRHIDGANLENRAVPAVQNGSGLERRRGESTAEYVQRVNAYHDAREAAGFAAAPRLGADGGDLRGEVGHDHGAVPA